MDKKEILETIFASLDAAQDNGGKFNADEFTPNKIGIPQLSLWAHSEYNYAILQKNEDAICIEICVFYGSMEAPEKYRAMIPMRVIELLPDRSVAIRTSIELTLDVLIYER